MVRGQGKRSGGACAAAESGETACQRERRLPFWGSQAVTATYRLGLAEIALVPEFFDVAVVLAVVRDQGVLEARALGRVGEEALGRVLRLGVLLIGLRRSVGKEVSCCCCCQDGESAWVGRR